MQSGCEDMLLAESDSPEQLEELHLSQGREISSRDYWKKGEEAISRTWWTLMSGCVVLSSPFLG